MKYCCILHGHVFEMNFSFEFLIVLLLKVVNHTPDLAALILNTQTHTHTKVVFYFIFVLLCLFCCLFVFVAVVVVFVYTFCCLFI